MNWILTETSSLCLSELVRLMAGCCPSHPGTAGSRAGRLFVFAPRKPRPWSSAWKTLSLLKLAILAAVLWLIVVVPDQCSSVAQASGQSLSVPSSMR